MTARCHPTALVLFALVLSACGGREQIGPSPMPRALSPSEPPTFQRWSNCRASTCRTTG